MIRIFTQDFQFVTEIDAYESLIWTRRWSKQGEFQIVVNQHMENVDELLEGRLVSGGPNKTGIIAHIEELTSESGKGSDQLLVKGYDLKGLMGKRLTLTPELNTYDALTANAETIMKRFVDRNAVSTTSNRVIPNLSIEPNKSRGPSFFYQTKYKELSAELEKISTASGVGWDVLFDGDGYIFNVVEGKDLTTLQNINPPVIFSAEFDNVREQKMIESSLDYRNVAIVAGQGEGTEREVILVGDASGMDRNEVFIDARDIEEGGNLPDRGLQKLSEYGRVEAFETSVLTYGPFIFGEDWDLGDIVTVQNAKKTRTAHVRVSEVTEVIEVGGYQLDVVFGQPLPTLIEKIKRELDEPEVNDGREGAPGRDGSDGETGIAGYTPVKGIDYFDGERGLTGERGETGLRGLTGERGETGPPGVDGVTPIKGVDYFDGERGLTGETGLRGIPGIDGKTPMKGVDYFDGERGEIGVQGKTGIGLQYAWNETRLGIKKEDQPSYEYVNLKGERGEVGLMGPPGSSQSYVLFEKEYVSTNNQTSFSWADGFNFPVGIRAVDLFINGNRQPLTSFTEHPNGKGITLTQPLSANEYILISAQMAVVDLQGPKGEQGEKGDTGGAGETGLRGLMGEIGPIGLTGLKGDDGDRGIQGVKGADGKTWYSTTAVPANSLGVIGDFHVNTATWDIREKTGASVWIIRGNIKGPQGDQGIRGLTGETGVTGTTGLNGEQGIQGPKGDKPNHQWSGTQLRFENPTGVFGSYVDLKGAKGDQGIQGIQGDQGIPGAAVADSVEWVKVLNKPTDLETTTGAQTKATAAQTNATNYANSKNWLANSDTRNNDSPPSFYSSRRITYEFKFTATLGVTGKTYCKLETLNPWTSHLSNTHVLTQIAYVGEVIFIRESTSTTAWSAWKQNETTADAQAKIDNYKPYHAGTTAPTNRNLIWIDTN
ncbi:Gp37-like protein [Sporosarcina sp. FA9]|uniref:Gp37-like protein n=1 Tax=Sporosarcina sp. FA9 TaxID=3413030 RepID=UPI003F65638B